MLRYNQSIGMTTSLIHDKPALTADFGDVRSEFQALVSGGGVFSLGNRGKIRLTGDDRVRWLNGMVTNNVRDLAPGHAVYAFLLSPQGRILGDLYAYNRGDSIVLDVEQERVAKLLEIFDHYIIMDDVTVEDVSPLSTAIGLVGPKSQAILQAIEIDVSGLDPLESRELNWRQVAITVARIEKEKRDGYEIWVAPENTGQVRDALLQNGATAVGNSAVDFYRIALGIPRYGQDIRERDLPQETRQDRALNFSKGCYVGQEIVERIRSRGAVHRIFSGFSIDGPLPAPGTKLQADGKDVAEITSSAVLPTAGANQVALGYVRREASAKELIAGASKATVAELPFKAIFG